MLLIGFGVMAAACTPAPPPPPTSPPSPPPLWQTTPVPSGLLGALGHTCAGVVAYINANDMPNTWTVLCPHEADGHQAETCGYQPNCPGGDWIYIDVPCPAAAMNETRNSWQIQVSPGVWVPMYPLDGFGYCGEPGNPFG
jgi:hypothetical protein